MENKTKKLTLFALLLALGYVLPFITSNIPEIGRVLSPLHFPVFLCGFLLGPIYGLILGIVLPLTRCLFFLTPAFPLCIPMAFELATYGFFSGLFIKIFKTKRKIYNIYFSLILSMLIGRIIWGISRGLLSLFINDGFNIQTFIKVGFITAWPGILLQLLIIPIIVKIFDKES